MNDAWGNAGFQWETTEKEIDAVLRFHIQKGIGNREVWPTDIPTRDILNIIDKESVFNAAMFSREDALGEIERQLYDLGILTGPRIIG